MRRWHTGSGCCRAAPSYTHETGGNESESGTQRVRPALNGAPPAANMARPRGAVLSQRWLVRKQELSESGTQRVRLARQRQVVCDAHGAAARRRPPPAVTLGDARTEREPHAMYRRAGCCHPRRAGGGCGAAPPSPAAAGGLERHTTCPSCSLVMRRLRHAWCGRAAPPAPAVTGGWAIVERELHTMCPPRALTTHSQRHS
jgi:hypothetical protein